MRISSLFEHKTFVVEKASQHSCLAELADHLLGQLPNKINDGESRYVRFLFTDYEVEKLIEKYPDMKTLLVNLFRLSGVEFTSKNAGKTGAAFVTKKGRTDGSIIVYRKTGEDTMVPSMPHYKRYLIHELRHFHQWLSYQDFFDAQPKTTYDKDPLEIDAAWIDHIEHHGPKNFKSPVDFAKSLMGDFSKYKTLTPKQTDHYFRKSVKVWLDYHMSETKTLPFKERVAAYKAKRRAELFSKFDTDRDINLKEIIPNYLGDNFLLPSRMAKQIVSLITNNVAPEGVNALLFLAVLRANGINGEALDGLWNRLTGETVKDSVSRVPSDSLPSGWDQESLTGYALNGGGD